MEMLEMHVILREMTRIPGRPPQRERERKRAPDMCATERDKI
jgi:hypothetical protein